MKVRIGFVSNSSSQCFILDMRKPGVDKVLAECIKLHVGSVHDVDRCTGMAVGRRAVDYAQEWNSEVMSWRTNKEPYPDDLGPWILRWAETLGEDNIVFLRDSDEGDYDGMGGRLPIIPQELIEAQMEYH